jgi:hypothetical protein
MSNLRAMNDYRDVFTATDVDNVEEFGSDHIVVNVRGGEILGNVHPDYGPVPLSLVRQAIEASGARPVFLGQLSDDLYSEAIRDRYPDAIYRPSRGVLRDFETLRRAEQLVVAVSTFSWLAAWLSQADVVHLPVCGFFHPLQCPNYDLLPSDDARYVFYECEPRKWSATRADFEYLWAPRLHRVLQPAEVERLRKQGRAVIGPEHRRRRRQLARKVYGYHVKCAIRRARVARGHDPEASS